MWLLFQLPSITVSIIHSGSWKMTTTDPVGPQWAGLQPGLHLLPGPGEPSLWQEGQDDTLHLQVSVSTQVCVYSDWNVWMASFPQCPVTQVSGPRSLWGKTGGTAMGYACHVSQRPCMHRCSLFVSQWVIDLKIAQVWELSKGLALYWGVLSLLLLPSFSVVKQHSPWFPSYAFPQGHHPCSSSPCGASPLAVRPIYWSLQQVGPPDSGQ